MKVLVLGAGVIGVTAAWYLAKAGHEVRVLERRDAAGLETSYANGGQVSADHAAPWAKPGVPLQALKWMLREDAPLLFRPRADLAQWRWGIEFLRNCTAARYRENAARLQALGRYSRDALRALRAETGIQYDQVARGILTLYTDGRTPTAGMLSPAQCIGIEPAVSSLRDKLAAGSYLADDESGDAHKFTVELAQLCILQGVRFDYGVTVDYLETDRGEITAVRAGAEKLAADAYVIALGSYSPLLTRPLGIDLPIYPLKGYSVTLPVRNVAAAWTVSLSDEAHKLVLSRMGDRLRIAGTAELNGYNTEINKLRCEAIVKRVMELFPEAGDATKPVYWAGLRPATPSNIPLVGGTKYPNLYLNTGHGTLGWTLACGSGKVLADTVSGRQPEI